MITRTDCILLLSDLEERGIDTTAILKETLKDIMVIFKLKEVFHSYVFMIIHT